MHHLKHFKHTWFSYLSLSLTLFQDVSLRSQFPHADGHLFEVVLERGQQGLGMSVVSSKSVIAAVTPKGVADQTGKIKRGDEILKVLTVLNCVYNHFKIII